MSAPFRLGPRDAFLQWDERTRGAHIGPIVINDRFLLVAGVQVPNLASHVLGLTLQRLARDWQRAHSVRPWLVETCVQSSRPGTSHKAAGWQCVGHTQGRPPGADEAVETKAVWLRGLEPDWQPQLCQPPERELGLYPELEPADLRQRRAALARPLAALRLDLHLTGVATDWWTVRGAVGAVTLRRAAL